MPDRPQDPAPTPRPERPHGAPESISRLRTAAAVGLGAALGAMRPAGPVKIDSGAELAARVRPIRTDRLVLRPLEAADRDEYLRVLRTSREHLERFCPLTTDERGEERPEAVWERQFELSRRALETGLAWRRIAVLAPGQPGAGRIAGAVNINDIARGLVDQGELVMWVAADLAGGGLGAEMTLAAIAHAMDDRPLGLGLHRVLALIDPANQPSVRLARRVGLRLEPGHPPVALRLGSRSVLHDTYAAYAPVAREIEGKPSVAEGVLGRGLLSILRTEGGGPGPAGDHVR